MPASLWFLIQLQLRGWLRLFLRNLSTVKGLLLAIVGGLVFLPWVASLLLTPRSQTVPAENVLLYGPPILLVYCLLNVLLSSGERAIYFTPGEVNFLFTAPFTRRQLLLYKIITVLLIGLPAVLFMVLVLRSYARSLPAAFLGCLLVYLFMSLFNMTLNLLGVAIGARLYTRTRLVVVLVLLAVVVALIITQGNLPGRGQWGEWFHGVLQTSWWQTLMWPLRSFFEVFLAQEVNTRLFLHAGVALGVNVFMLGLVLYLDADYLETAAKTSAQVYQRIQQMRRGSVPIGKVRFSLPSFPYWGGVGPTVWRQMLSAVRGLGRLMLVVMIAGFLAIAMFLGSVGDAGEVSSLLPALGMIIVWMTIFITMLVPFDFRGDIDHMAYLKTLPVASWRLALGQILTPTILLTILHVVVLVGFLLYPRLSGHGPGEADRWLVVCAAFSFPFNFLLFALENMLFLFFPVRVMATSPGDFQAMGRNMLMVMAKMIILMVVGTAAVIAGWIVYFITGEGLLPGVAVAWMIVVVAGAAMLPLVSFAFQKFDVTRDIPA